MELSQDWHKRTNKRLFDILADILKETQPQPQQRRPGLPSMPSHGYTISEKRPEVVTAPGVYFPARKGEVLSPEHYLQKKGVVALAPRQNEGSVAPTPTKRQGWLERLSEYSPFSGAAKQSRDARERVEGGGGLSKWEKSIETEPSKPIPLAPRQYGGNVDPSLFKNEMTSSTPFEDEQANRIKAISQAAVTGSDITNPSATSIPKTPVAPALTSLGTSSGKSYYDVHPEENVKDTATQLMERPRGAGVSEIPSGKPLSSFTPQIFMAPPKPFKYNPAKPGLSGSQEEEYNKKKKPYQDMMERLSGGTPLIPRQGGGTVVPSVDETEEERLRRLQAAFPDELARNAPPPSVPDDAWKGAPYSHLSAVVTSGDRKPSPSEVPKTALQRAFPEYPRMEYKVGIPSAFEESIPNETLSSHIPQQMSPMMTSTTKTERVPKTDAVRSSMDANLDLAAASSTPTPTLESQWGIKKEDLGGGKTHYTFPEGQGIAEVAQVRPTPTTQYNRENWPLRTDGTKKGLGWLGVLPMMDGSGRVATEMTIGVNFDGKDMIIPAMVPNLRTDEINYILGGGSLTNKSPMAISIMEKAVEHAKDRMRQGESVFAPEEKQPLSDYAAKEYTGPSAEQLELEQRKKWATPGYAESRLAEEKAKSPGTFAVSPGYEKSYWDAHPAEKQYLDMTDAIRYANRNEIGAMEKLIGQTQDIIKGNFGDVMMTKRGKREARNAAIANLPHLQQGLVQLMTGTSGTAEKYYGADARVAAVEAKAAQTKGATPHWVQNDKGEWVALYASPLGTGGGVANVPTGVVGQTKTPTTPGRKSEKAFDPKTGQTYQQDYEWKDGAWSPSGEKRIVSGSKPSDQGLKINKLNVIRSILDEDYANQIGSDIKDVQKKLNPIQKEAYNRILAFAEKHAETMEPRAALDQALRDWHSTFGQKKPTQTEQTGKEKKPLSFFEGK